MCHSKAKHTNTHTLTQLSEHGCTEKTGGEKKKIKKRGQEAIGYIADQERARAIMAGSYHYREDAHKEKAVIKERLRVGGWGGQDTVIIKS